MNAEPPILLLFEVLTLFKNQELYRFLNNLYQEIYEFLNNLY